MTPQAAVEERGSGIYYGWWVVAAAFAAVMMSFGPLIVFPFGLFLKELTREFGWTRASVSLAFSLAALTVAVASPFLGKASDRWGARRVILACSPVFGLLIASLSLLTPSLLHLYLVFIGIGVVANGATQLTYARIISTWFDRRRGLALALVMSGVGAGAVLFPLLAERMIVDSGWRSAYLAIGLIAVATTTPLALFVVRDAPDGRSEPGAARPAVPAHRKLQKSILFSLLAAFFLLSFGANGCIAHLAALLTDKGIGMKEAALATSVLGGASVVGRLLTGVLIDRFFAPRVGFVFVGGSAGAILLLVSPSLTTALVAAAMLGLAIGAEADLMPYLLGRYFTLERFGELYGYAFSAYAVAGATGPLFMGWLFDTAGSYRVALLVFTVTTALAAVLIARLPAYDTTPARGL